MHASPQTCACDVSCRSYTSNNLSICISRRGDVVGTRDIVGASVYSQYHSIGVESLVYGKVWWAVFVPLKNGFNSSSKHLLTTRGCSCKARGDGQLSHIIFASGGLRVLLLDSCLSQSMCLPRLLYRYSALSGCYMCSVSMALRCFLLVFGRADHAPCFG